jgi:hypothetical protein
VDDFNRTIFSRFFDALLQVASHLAFSRVVTDPVLFDNLTKAVIGIFFEHIGAVIPAHPAACALFAIDGNFQDYPSSLRLFSNSYIYDAKEKISQEVWMKNFSFFLHNFPDYSYKI